MTAKDDPKPRKFNLNETLMRQAKAKDPSPITGGRIREIARARREGIEIDTTPAEDAVYERFNAAMSQPVSAAIASALPQMGSIKLAVSKMFETETNIRTLKQIEPTIIDKIRTNSPHEMDIFNLEHDRREKDEKRAAEKERRRNLEDQHLELAAHQSKALAALLENTLSEQVASASREEARIEAAKERDQTARVWQFSLAFIGLLTLFVTVVGVLK